ncbi:hypothetical protein NIES4073_55390 [Kalymmatonema gypsitolerans NIES-4073]|nr:hypothetical protein NIES4073_55390 [Scytonema sp. NIES-4073]
MARYAIAMQGIGAENPLSAMGERECVSSELSPAFPTERYACLKEARSLRAWHKPPLGLTAIG